jgi:GT2 family glycosyltransferase
MTDLSVVIVSFNTRDVLSNTISAILEDAHHLHMELIVVDNASSDGSAAMVRERFPSVALLANADNRFYSAGNNQALSRSRGRYILVLNPDAHPARGTIPAMVSYMDAHPSVGALSPRLCFPDGRVQKNCSRSRTYRLLLCEHSVLALVCRRSLRRLRDEHWYASWDRLSERQVGVLPGSCIMVRRDVLDRVGGFDERLRMYFSDDDWCERIAASGYQVMYAPIGTVIHAEGASVVHNRRVARRLYFDDMIRYTAKRFGRLEAFWLWALAAPMRLALDFSGALRG